MGKKKNNLLRNSQTGGTGYNFPDDIVKLRKELVKPVKESRREDGRKFKNSSSSTGNGHDTFDRKGSRYKTGRSEWTHRD